MSNHKKSSGINPQQDTRMIDDRGFRLDHMDMYGIYKTDLSITNGTALCYGIFLLDHMSEKVSQNHSHILPCPSFIDKNVFYGQGADFFAPPLLAMTIGQYACHKTHIVLEKVSDKKAKTFRDNWRGIRSGVTLGLLGAYEGVQSLVSHKKYDTDDFAAYAIGLGIFMHKKDILRAAVETVSVLGHQTEKAVKSIFGFRTDKLV